ncbi:hypothetical protein GIZ89_23785 [Salmonella enterica]|nr:hypothetical protein [Salmonella enterica]EEM9540047.1 hypothetical protein [Salmonella enterica]EEN0874143.1 hypothetical protein [Salmonella enterica]EEN1611315.1 hypothetical protein [Salmonella enterica]EIE8403128.1 hypothetical protein [Salmonella enterica]
MLLAKRNSTRWDRGKRRVRVRTVSVEDYTRQADKSRKLKRPDDGACSELIKGFGPFTSPLIEENEMSLEKKVVNILVKRGWNIDTAKTLVEKNIAFAVKIRPEATPGKLAEIVTCL